MALKLIIAEDNDLFRDTLGQLLTAWGKAGKLVGEAKNGADAVTLVERLTPDLLILDLHLPKIDGFDVMQAVLSNDPSLKILVLTMNRSKKMLQQSFNCGARGYCTKTRGKETILKAVEQVSKGKIYISPDMRNDSISY